jgi:hypothetical protein
VQLTDLLNRYGDIATYLCLDLVAIFVMTYVLYFRRHWRADLLLSYVALNIGIFVTMSLLTQVRLDIAVGFGLFAILSIIRLRSSAVTQQEVAYYFIALVLGLVNGMGVPDRGLVVGMNVVLLLALLAIDTRHLRNRAPAHGRSPRRGVHERGRAGGRARAQAGRASGLRGDHRNRPDPRPHAHRRAAAARAGRRRAATAEVASPCRGRRRTGAGVGPGRPWRDGGLELRWPTRR